MGKSDSLEKRTAFYEDKEKGIRFFQNPIEHNAYDVFIGNNHFYIPDRIIPGLAAHYNTTTSVKGSLDAMNPNIQYILESNNIRYEDLHIAILKVRNLELENEISNILSSHFFSINN